MGRFSVWVWAPLQTRRGQTGVSSSRAPRQMGLAQPGAQMAPEGLAADRNLTMDNEDKIISLGL